jgi:hypothetical protein
MIQARSNILRSEIHKLLILFEEGRVVTAFEGNVFHEILPLPCEYIFTLMNSVVNNQERFQKNPKIHSVNSGNKDHRHRRTANISCFQKSAYDAGIKIFKCLP